ncbi:MAG: hypothetical protein ACLU37_06965 [Collinsella sp.]
MSCANSLGEGFARAQARGRAGRFDLSLFDPRGETDLRLMVKSPRAYIDSRFDFKKPASSMRLSTTLDWRPAAGLARADVSAHLRR